MKNKFIKFHRLFRQNLITSEDHGGAIEDARSCTCKHCCEFFFVNPDRLKEQSHEIKVWFFCVLVHYINVLMSNFKVKISQWYSIWHVL